MFMNGVAGFISLTFIIGGIAAEDYCNLPGCNDDHIACRNKGFFANSCPADARSVNMTDFRELILGLFNDMRNKVAGGEYRDFPRAARMVEMQWCAELEYLAHLEARTCHYGVKCHPTKYFPKSGQIAYIYLESADNSTVSDADDIRNSIEGWLADGKDITSSLIGNYTKTDGKALGIDFAIPISENNTHVGCGLVRFTRDLIEYFIFVCNFAIGIIYGEPIYTADEVAASGCPNRYGANKNYPNLCSVKQWSD